MAIHQPAQRIFASDLRDRGAFLGNIPDWAEVSEIKITFSPYVKERHFEGRLDWVFGYYPKKASYYFDFWEQIK